MEDTSRRELFRIIGSSIVLTAAGSGVLSPALAQHVHAEIAAVKSLSGGPNYVPKKFTPHNFLTLKKLGDIIIPGASDAGAAEFIDFLSSHNDELAAIFNGGFGWLDNYMQKTYGADFLNAAAAQQTELLDKLAYAKNRTPETAPGVHFWTWTRNMVVDAYYTSPAGVKDLGYMGNGAMKVFNVPQEAVDYAIKRSPFANEG
ncbi:MAG TPA: gluconate 2-dehydrogenase subunit 3 family protein [Bryobacteraceae bacterium]|jgi:gluconate 2-dehydrogenase gamma chain|nr:gluconate 2-dehydrogenase subunit 3 family protein [Bryobacteraceae bacterium]